MGVVFILRLITISPQVVADENGKKTPHSIKFTDCCHPPNREHPSNWQAAKRRRKGGKFAMLLKNPNVFLFPLNWQPTKRGEKGKTFEKFSKIFTTPLTYTREFRTACTTQKQHNLQIVYYSCLYYICQFTMLLSKPNYKAPHLIATGNAFCQGAFSKIQTMFTISSHIKALGKDES